MSNNQTTTKWRHPSWVYVTFILACIIGAAALVVFVSTKFTTSPSLQVENWVSYLVSLIGICATLMVGSQVLNFIEIRKYVSDADSKKKELEELQIRLQVYEDNIVLLDRNSNYVGNALYIIADNLIDDDLPLKTFCLIHSLTCLFYPSDNADNILIRLSEVQSNLNSINTMSDKWKEAFRLQFEDLNKIDVKDCSEETRITVLGKKAEVLSLLLNKTQTATPPQEIE